MTITRKDFLRGTLAVAAGGLGLTTFACGDDEETTSSSAGPTSSGSGGGSSSTSTTTSSGMGGMGGNSGGGCTATIAANHGHQLVVTEQDVTAGADKTYDIAGSAGHPHMVTLTSGDFGMLQNGMTVMVTSTTDTMHSHDVTVSCA